MRFGIGVLSGTEALPLHDKVPADRVVFGHFRQPFLLVSCYLCIGIGVLLLFASCHVHSLRNQDDLGRRGSRGWGLWDLWSRRRWHGAFVSVPVPVPAQVPAYCAL